MNLHKLLAEKYKGKQYTLRGDQYVNFIRLVATDDQMQPSIDEALLKGLEWSDPSPKPTTAELEEKWNELMAEEAKKAVLMGQLATKIAMGYPVPQGFSLALDEHSWNLLSLLLLGLTNSGYPDNGPVEIWDKYDVEQVVTFAEFKEIMKGYFIEGYGMFKAKKRGK